MEFDFAEERSLPLDAILHFPPFRSHDASYSLGAGDGGGGA